MNQIVFLTLNEVLSLHELLIEQFGGSCGTRDMGLLESALAQAEMISIYQKNDLHLIAASYLFHIIKNHPFIDGNKRTGSTAAVWFLHNNRYRITLTNDQLYKLAIDVATSQISKPAIANFLKRHSKVLT